MQYYRYFVHCSTYQELLRTGLQQITTVKTTVETNSWLEKELHMLEANATIVKPLERSEGFRQRKYFLIRLLSETVSC